MGPRVLSVHVRAEDEEERATGGRGNAKERAAARAAARKGVLSLRLYAACTATAAGLPAGSVTLLALNLRSEPVAFPVEPNPNPNPIPNPDPDPNPNREGDRLAA